MQTRPMRRRPHRPAPGFHLLELLVVVMLLAILLSLGWGPWQRVVLRLQADSLRAELTSSLVLARSTALAQRRRVTVCGSLDGMSCSPSWNHGWLVRTEDRPWPGGAAGRVVRVHRRAPNRVEVRASPHRPHVQFRPDGRNAGTNQSLILCADGREHSRVVINVIGRVRGERSLSAKQC